MIFIVEKDLNGEIEFLYRFDKNGADTTEEYLDENGDWIQDDSLFDLPLDLDGKFVCEASLDEAKEIVQQLGFPVDTLFKKESAPLPQAA